MDLLSMPFFWACLVPAIVAAYIDFKREILPNYLTVTIFTLGLIQGFFYDSWPQIFYGVAAGLIFSIPGVIMGQLGMGDLKLMAGLGSWIGPAEFTAVLFISCWFGVAWAIYKLARSKKLKQYVFNFWLGISTLIFSRKLPKLRRLPDDPDAPAPPGAVAFGTCLVAGLCVYTIMHLQDVSLAAQLLQIL